MHPRHLFRVASIFTHSIFILILCSLWGSLAGRAAAQSGGTTRSNIPSGLAPGAPTGSYLMSDFEAISLYTGRLNLSLPMPTLLGRGDVSYTPTLNVNPYTWTTGFQLVYLNPTYIWYQNASTVWWDGSIKAGYGPGTVVMRQLGSGLYTDLSNGSPVDYYLSARTNLIFTTSNGTEIEFYDQQNNGAGQSRYKE